MAVYTNMMQTHLASVFVFKTEPYGAYYMGSPGQGTAWKLLFHKIWGEREQGSAFPRNTEVSPKPWVIYNQSIQLDYAMYFSRMSESGDLRANEAG